MRIALITSAYYPSLGGVEEMVRQLCRLLRERGHEVVVITNRWPRNLAEYEKVEGVDVYRVPMRAPTSQLRAKVSYYATNQWVEHRVNQILREHKIELIHIHCLSTNADYALRSHSRLGIPCVATLHGELTMDANQVFQRSSRARELYRKTLAGVDAVTACSGQTLTEAEEFLGVPFGDRGRVIYNGVHSSEFTSGEASHVEGPYVFGIGRLVHQKGFDVLLRAFAKVCESDVERRLVLAGDGQERETLEGLAKDLGIADRVDFVGRVDRAGVVSWFKGCECFVLSSRHEPFGIVNLEAMAGGAPIIATRVGGVPEFVKDEINGLLVEPDDPTAMAAALTRMIQEPKLRERLAEAGTACVKEFDWPVVTEQYEEVYREVLNRGSGSHPQLREGEKVSVEDHGAGELVKVGEKRKPHLCMIFEAIGPYSAIGKIAMAEVEIALEAGWEVTVVAKLLDESLHGKVEWLKLYCPPRGFILQWSTARFFIKRALGKRRFDVVHAHQPQVADLADVFQCHYITRWAHEQNGLRAGPGLRGYLNEIQQLGAMYQEEHYYSRWNPNTKMLFNSPLTNLVFSQLYGDPEDCDVLHCTFDPVDVASDEKRLACREKLVGHNHENLVIGYLGGMHLRKGYRGLLKALQDCPNVTCLLGGKGMEGYVEPGLEGRLRGVGHVNDLAGFYNACDAFIVPSVYEPFGLVAYEAASHGVPVIATDAVGALPMLLEYGGGLCWDPTQPLGPLVEEVVENRERYRVGLRRMCDENGESVFRKKLLAIYQSVLDNKQGGRHA